MHYAQGAERALWTNSVLLCRDLTSPLAPSLEKWQQRQRMLHLWTEGKNAKPKKLQINQGSSSQQATYSPRPQDPSGQSGVRISPSPANQKPRSGPLPVAFSLSAAWAVAERTGRLLNSLRPLSSPRALKRAWLLCLIWSAEEQQVKRSTREHYLWSNKCRVALSLENILRALMIQTETLMPCIWPNYSAACIQSHNALWLCWL